MTNRQRKPTGRKRRRRSPRARWVIETCLVPLVVAALPYLVEAGRYLAGVLERHLM